MRELAVETVNSLKDKHLSFATAESCTGGMISALITTVSGVSSVYYGGMVTYNNDIKHRLLGVSEETLRTYTAVSKETAEEMAKNICEKTGAMVGVSVTGNAGPLPSEGKPVGLVYVSVYSEKFQKTVEVERSLLWKESRDKIREKATKKALELLKEVADKY